MLVTQLLGGNGIKGINRGTVFIDDKELVLSYEELVQICGNISLGALSVNQSDRGILRDYIELVEDLESEDVENSEEFVIENHLTKAISYSEYEIDIENKTLILKINTYN